MISYYNFQGAMVKQVGKLTLEVQYQTIVKADRIHSASGKLFLIVALYSML